MEKQLITLKNPYKAKFGIKLSRNERRLAEKEIKVFETRIEPIVSEFENELFDEFDETYNDLYSYYLDQITRICNWFNKYSFKIIQVDNYFFHETYKPLECN